MRDFDSFSEGDDVQFSFSFCSIPGSSTRSGEVSDVLTVPTLGTVLFVVVESPTRLIEYELRESPADESEQVVKRLVAGGEEVGRFGPLVSVS